AAHPGLLHAGPLEPEDHRRHAESLAITRDLLHHARRVADDEALARQLLEAPREGLAGGQRLVLLPAPVRTVLRVQERGGLRERRGRRRRDVALLDQRRLERGRAPELPTRRPEERLLALEGRERRVRVHQPGVAEARRAPDARVGVRRKPDGRAGALQRTQRDSHVAEAEVLALVAHRLAVPQLLDHLETLDEARDPRLRVLAHRLVLHVPVAEADAEDEPPARDHVERGDLLGNLDRVVEREEETARAERHAGGVGRDAPERRDRLEVGERGGEIVLARPHGGEAQRARQPDLLDVLLEPCRLRLVRKVLDREPEAELHGSRHTRPGGGSSVKANCGSAMWSARSWKTTRTRVPIATLSSASGLRSGVTRLAMIRSASSGVGIPRCSSSSTRTTA